MPTLATRDVLPAPLDAETAPRPGTEVRFARSLTNGLGERFEQGEEGTIVSLELGEVGFGPGYVDGPFLRVRTADGRTFATFRAGDLETTAP